MKIETVKTFVVDAYRANYVFVKIIADDGTYGVGEGTVEHREQAVAHAIGEFEPLLLGRDPFATDATVELLSRDSYWRTGVVIRSAIAAIEAALLDLKGKALGVPVYELLGGKQRDCVPVYGNAWFAGARTAEDFAEKARLIVAQGWRALKWDPFGQNYLRLERTERMRAIGIVEAVRAAVGLDVELMIEGHGRFDVSTAISVAKDLAPFRPYWFEEPIPPESIPALADVRSKSPVPIAAGERYYEIQRFQELIAAHAVDYLQPDVSHVGGLAEARRIAAIAHAQYLPICPHNPLGPIANAMTLHVAASTPNFAWLETMVSDVSWRSEIVREHVVIRDGHMVIPTTPGLGIDINEDACAEYPPKPYLLRHYNGSLTNIRPAASVPFYQTA
ncbi:mandelate racemase/muconate lactonizing enzyme family protein [Mesorhizobium sp. YR577]|jgi:galactonate dehydratase|uniref:mandelate racemase/muconate lactonizing enzyme family protein n=1 Tax=Mesorhizobium sp. YR577 TaxID=1884373 RepID=UPI0008EFA345|nr:mandelate racemase/muconate lactonizing enzyme family protein [Mesorhizobium sp. YR577]SFU16409.1 galactonate dehydratase [Mesorhizobium sp. YR577]